MPYRMTTTVPVYRFSELPDESKQKVLNEEVREDSGQLIRTYSELGDLIDDFFKTRGMVISNPVSAVEPVLYYYASSLGLARAEKVLDSRLSFGGRLSFSDDLGPDRSLPAVQRVLACLNLVRPGGAFHGLGKCHVAAGFSVRNRPLDRCESSVKVWIDMRISWSDDSAGRALLTAIDLVPRDPERYALLLEEGLLDLEDSYSTEKWYGADECWGIKANLLSSLENWLLGHVLAVLLEAKSFMTDTVRPFYESRLAAELFKDRNKPLQQGPWFYENGDRVPEELVSRSEIVKFYPKIGDCLLESDPKGEETCPTK